MSTKIYNAFKFKKSFSELVPFLKDVREEIENDTVFYYKSRFPQNRIPKVVDLIKKIRQAKLKREFEWNIESSVAVFFHNEDIYLIFFFPGHFGRSDRNLSEKWANEIEDFHYQNSTDRPEHITEDEWDARSIVTGKQED